MVYGNCYLLSVICYLYSKKNRFWKLSTVTLGDDVIDLSCDFYSCIDYTLYPSLQKRHLR